jgi:hypothetical protein
MTGNTPQGVEAKDDSLFLDIGAEARALLLDDGLVDLEKVTG